MIENDERNYLNDGNPLIHLPSNGTGSNEHNINVVIRVRPVITSQRTLNKSITPNEPDQRQVQQDDQSDVNQSTAITFPVAGQIQVHDTIANVNRSFAFNVVFEPEATQEEVFQHSGIKRLIDMALDGFACTVFAYGQTSTGKTYTLTGNAFQYARESTSASSSMGYSKRNSRKDRPTQHQASLSNGNRRTMNEQQQWQSTSGNNESQMDGGPDLDETWKKSSSSSSSTTATANNNNNSTTMKNIGIVQLSFAYLFEQIKQRKRRDKTLYVITVSYLEVYNEQVLDLLNPSPRCLNVRWAKDRGFYAENLFKVECEDLGDLEGVLEEGCKNRQVRSHSMNENSSRSHSVMTITLHSEIVDPEDPQSFIRKEGRLCLVDLAGSEKTKRTNSKGGTFVEANNINRSLLVLGNCIACLADPKHRNGHIPYRDSTLTKLLADSLSGNGMTLMIACVSPLKCDSQETISTLRYASRAKRVRMNPVVQMDPRELLILSLKREVRMLKLENNYLRQNYHQIWANSQQDAANGLSAHPFSLDDAIDSGHQQQQQQQQHQHQQLLAPQQHSQRHSPWPLQPPTASNKDENNNLLNKYMRENEILRVENLEINLQRNRLVRDHELVCRENEQLLRKLNMLLFRLNMAANINDTGIDDLAGGAGGGGSINTTAVASANIGPAALANKRGSMATTLENNNIIINSNSNHHNNNGNNNNNGQSLFSSASSPSILSLPYDDDSVSIGRDLMSITGNNGGQQQHRFEKQQTTTTMARTTTHRKRRQPTPPRNAIQTIHLMNDNESVNDSEYPESEQDPLKENDPILNRSNIANGFGNNNNNQKVSLSNVGGEEYHRSVAVNNFNNRNRTTNQVTGPSTKSQITDAVAGDSNSNNFIDLTIRGKSAVSSKSRISSTAKRY